MKHKSICVLLCIVLLAVLGAGCSSPGAGDKSARQKEQEPPDFILGDTTFNGENGEEDLNPHHDCGGWACIRYGVGETLFRFTDEMEIEPWLAESFKQTDELTWQISLRKGIYFTSGRQMDAQAVRECLEDLVLTHDQAAEDLKIQSIRAVDDSTLEIRTDEPAPSLPNHLADPYSCIIDMDAGVSEEGIVQGTGPYRAVSLVPDTSLDLVRNNQYWGKEPGLQRIRIRTITDGDTLTMALQSGEVDAAYGVPYLSYPLFENEDYTFTSCATSRVFYCTMNFDSPVTEDPAVRQAIAMGIDKDGFSSALLQGNGYPASGVYPDLFSFGGGQIQADAYDPSGAAEVLEKAGWKDTDGDGVREKDGRPLVIRWLTYPSRQELPVLAESAQATLQEIGIRVEIINTPDHNTVKQDSSAWDVYASAMVAAPTGDPAYFFEYRCLEQAGGNDGHYYNAQLEELAQKMRITFDQKERESLAVRMQQTILEDRAFVFCAYLKMSMISRSDVSGLTAHPCDYYEITADLTVR